MTVVSGFFILDNIKDFIVTLEMYVRRFCRDNAVSISELAKHANISRNTLYGIMKDGSPTLVNIIKLAVAMEVHPQFLIQLEWEKYRLSDELASPVKPLPSANTWFHTLTDNVHFVNETIPDGSLIRTNETFVKTWRLQNTGNRVWKNRWLVCQNHDDHIHNEPRLRKFVSERCFVLTPKHTRIAVPTTDIGDTVDLSVEFTAPSVPASAFSYWKMADSSGKLCFPNSIGVYAYVQVISSGSAEYDKQYYENLYK